MTTQVECADYFPATAAALRAHATQIDADSTFFAVPHELHGGGSGRTRTTRLALAYVPVEHPSPNFRPGSVRWQPPTLRRPVGRGRLSMTAGR